MPISITHSATTKSFDGKKYFLYKNEIYVMKFLLENFYESAKLIKNNNCSVMFLRSIKNKLFNQIRYHFFTSVFNMNVER